MNVTKICRQLQCGYEEYQEPFWRPKCESDRKNMSSRYAINFHVDIKSHFEGRKYENNKRKMPPNPMWMWIISRAILKAESIEVIKERCHQVITTDPMWIWRMLRAILKAEGMIDKTERCHWECFYWWQHGSVCIWIHQCWTKDAGNPDKSKGVSNMWICVSKLLFSLQKMK